MIWKFKLLAKHFSWQISGSVTTVWMPVGASANHGCAQSNDLVSSLGLKTSGGNQVCRTVVGVCWLWSF
jgi:hypothetical protein